MATTTSLSQLDRLQLDTDCGPGDDFFKYVNNSWLEENTIPNDYSRWGVFEILHEETLTKLQSLIQHQREDPSSDFFKLLQVYQAGMDEAQLQQEGIDPIKSMLRRIHGITDLEQLSELLAFFATAGVSTLFSLDVEADAKNTSLNVLYLSQDGLGMPDRDFYVLASKHEEQQAYQLCLRKLLSRLQLDGISHLVSAIYQMEVELAKVSQTRTERRDPHKTYHAYTPQMLQEEFPLIAWQRFFSKVGVQAGKVVVDNPPFFKKVNEMLSAVPLAKWKLYLTSRLLLASAPFLDDQNYQTSFDFYQGKLSGQLQPKPRWKRVITTVENHLGELLGKLYVDRYFSDQAKDKASELVHNLIQELHQRILGLDWMSSNTKEKAVQKLASLRVKVGYPVRWRDFKGLQFLGDFNYWNTITQCHIFNFRWMVDQLYQPVDKEKWEMNAHTINAYYHPLLNEIVFPAGILQPPFYSYNYCDAFNYGAIGAIIGHEMTHGFDDQGRKFDYQGNMRDWWTPEDEEKYQKKSDRIKEQYASYQVEGEYLNGELTLGENIADIGGVTISYQAFQNRAEYQQLDSESQRQEDRKFFLSWGRAWRTKIRKEEMVKRLLTDPHSPAALRVNGVLFNIPGFHRAFQLQLCDRLYQAPEQIASVW